MYTAMQFSHLSCTVVGTALTWFLLQQAVLFNSL